MEAKKLPRRILLYIMLFGAFMGQLLALGTMLVCSQILGSWSLAFLGWGIVIAGLYTVWISLAFKYRNSLEEWGLVDKPKKGEKEG